MVYGNKTAESQSAQRTNERRRLLLRSKYAILFKYCNKDEFHVSANSASLRLIIVVEKIKKTVGCGIKPQSRDRTEDDGHWRWAGWNEDWVDLWNLWLLIAVEKYKGSSDGSRD